MKWFRNKAKEKLYDKLTESLRVYGKAISIYVSNGYKQCDLDYANEKYEDYLLVHKELFKD